MSLVINKNFKTIVVLLLLLVFGTSFVPASFAFPAFTESEISKTSKNHKDKKAADSSYEQNETLDSIGQYIKSKSEVLSDIDLKSRITEKWEQFLASEYYNKASQFCAAVANKVKQLWQGSKKELKPVTKYVDKEWQGVKKDLKIKSSGGGTSDIGRTIDNEIEDTKQEIRNFIADPKLLELKSRFDKGNSKII